MLEAPRLHVTDAAGFAGVWREVHIEEWTSPASAAQLRARHVKRRAFIDELAARKMITITIVRDAAIKPLDKDQRAAVDEGVAQANPHTKAGAVMIGANGFRAVVIRSVLAAVTLVQGARHPTKTFDDLDATFAWIGPHLDGHGGVVPTVQDLTVAYRALVAASSAAS